MPMSRPSVQNIITTGQLLNASLSGAMLVLGIVVAVAWWVFGKDRTDVDLSAKIDGQITKAADQAKATTEQIAGVTAFDPDSSGGRRTGGSPREGRPPVRLGEGRADRRQAWREASDLDLGGRMASRMQVARVYLRVSTDEQDLARQERIIEEARGGGYYIAGVYREKASGARADRPELQRLIQDLQPGEVVVAEKIDRISRLPLADAERLVGSIKAKGARLVVPGLVDLSELADEATGVAKIVLEAVQGMLLRLALQMAHDDYEDRRLRQRQGIELAKRGGRYSGRRPDRATHDRIRYWADSSK